ncbi:hypothetical protein FSP39_023978 [Pinctada imbricata]|uniref:C1q domain-containing protein n=1 Tax=Pinctada imbricata TaxID=66713 RepID=A0AA88Y5H3_PINIB|nr:hypothetical protein FSP39_023978 [Pinctada imbricata]
MAPIAFFAELGHTLDKPNVGSPVIFDVVHLNDGNAYNNIHGVFTAPVSGLYHFTLELASPNEGSALHKVRVQMMRSWYVVGYVFLDGDGPYWSKSSATATLHLSRGDDIWVKVMYRDGQAQIAGSSYHSIFSGFLIRSV